MCCDLTAEDCCAVCRSPRSDAVICVVEEPQDVLAFERSGEFRGRYHVLHGALSPLDGVSPGDLRIQPLLERLRFLTICSTNLDEFFEIRVAGLKEQVAYSIEQPGPDGLTPQETLRQISEIAHGLVEEQYAVLNEVLLPKLDKQGIRLLREEDWNSKQKAWLKRFFNRELAPIISPVSSISMARFGETTRDRATIGVEQKRPIFTPGVPNRASSAARARSQVATSWQPAAVAMPWTLAITGCRSRVIASIICEQVSKVRLRKSGSGFARISLRSWPAQNPRPAPSTTTTFTAGSRSISSRVETNSSIKPRQRAL